MKKNILLAVVGAAALTGCMDNEVMKSRGFVPAPQDDVEVTTTAPMKAEETSVPSEQNIPAEQSVKSAAAPAPVEFPPMTGDFGTEKGITAASGEYIVKSGDTLGKIAAANHVKLADLMKANGLSEKDARRLRIGQKLVIPGGKAVAKSEGKSVRAASAPAVKADIKPGEYIVKSGDTPERIARRAGVKLSALMDANNLTEEDARRLRIGQKLVIPEPGKAVAKSSATAEQKNVAAKADDPAADAGDDLAKQMSQATVDPQGTGTPKAEVPAQAAAPDTTGDVPAAEETTMADITEDTTLEAVAKRYNTNVETLRKLNPDLGNPKVLKSGEVLLVPKQ